MSVYDDDDDVDESGSTLRRRLEETLDRNKALTTELTGLKAKSLIEEHGHRLVKPEDLDGVEPDQMADRAQALQEERQTQQVDLARDMLAQRGLAGDELEAAVADFLSPSSGQDTAAFGRVKETSAVGGNAARLVNPDALHGLDAIEFALQQRSK